MALRVSLLIIFSLFDAYLPIQSELLAMEGAKLCM